MKENKYRVWRAKEGQLYALRSNYDHKNNTLYVGVYPDPQEEHSAPAVIMSSLRHKIKSKDFKYELVVDSRLEAILERCERALETQNITEDQNFVPKYHRNRWKNDDNFNYWYHSIADYDGIK